MESDGNKGGPMSVGLAVLKGGGESGHDCQDVEVMAPDYGREYIWLWNESDASNRIDLNQSQMIQLRDLLNQLL